MSTVYEYVCDRVIPGCEHRIRGDTPEAVQERARQHLHEHHGMVDIDQPSAEVIAQAMVMVRVGG